MHKSLGEFWSDPTNDYGVSCHLTSKNSMSLFSVSITPNLLKLSSNEDIHNILDE